MPARADDFQALSDSLYHWAVYEPAVKCEIGCTALKLAAGWAIIDPVPLADDAWAQLLALAPLRAILLTNGNHVREAGTLRTRYQVPIVTAPDTRRAVTELKPDISLLPHELLYGIQAISIPGAAEGETAFFSDLGVLTLGDAVINVSTADGLQFLPDKYCTDVRQNRESLRKLLAYNFHTLTLAHGAPVVSRAKEKFEALLQS